jgi:hypothetical protein
MRSGQLHAVETDRVGRELAPRAIGPGEFCGTLPVDPRGATAAAAARDEPSGVLCIPGDGFWYLWSSTPRRRSRSCRAGRGTLRERLLSLESCG